MYKSKGNCKCEMLCPLSELSKESALLAREITERGKLEEAVMIRRIYTRSDKVYRRGEFKV